CAPYCFEYNGTHTISHRVHVIFSQSGMRMPQILLAYCVLRFAGNALSIRASLHTALSGAPDLAKTNPWTIDAIHSGENRLLEMNESSCSRFKFSTITGVTCWLTRVYLRLPCYDFPGAALLSRRENRSCHDPGTDGIGIQCGGLHRALCRRQEVDGPTLRCNRSRL